MTILINACARPNSRTWLLANYAAQQIAEDYEVVNLYEEEIKPLDYVGLLFREECGKKSDFSDDRFRFAKQFKEADEIVIAAPYWDLSFPAVLKCYFEAICVGGLTFFYGEKGIPQGLCKAKRLTFITTAGGWIPEQNFAFDYVKQLCTGMLGVKDTLYIKAEGLDIYGADTEKILQMAKEDIDLKLNKKGTVE